MKPLLTDIATRLMRCPAAPYHEDLVVAEAIRICKENRLQFRIDPFGNILVQCARQTVKHPIVLAAHMDHPGFIVRKRTSARSLSVRFLGGVGDSYFRTGTKLLLMPGRIRAKLGKRTHQKKRDFEVHATSDVSAKVRFAVWDLPEFRAAKDRLHGRVCDDLIGVATILAVLIELRGSTAGRNVIGVLSRAEEVGFQGALALAKSNRLSPESLIISLETSRELPPVKMGGGVIVRVGDRASIFDSTATRFLTEVAGDLRKKDPKFQFQRALMGGGTCEATAYQEYGYRSAAVCVALGNYHNCGKNNRIAAEYVSASDAESMGRLLVQCAREWPRFERYTRRLVTQLERLAREGKHKLIRKKLEGLER